MSEHTSHDVKSNAKVDASTARVGSAESGSRSLLSSGALTLGRSSTTLIALQRLIGNRAVTKLTAPRHLIQPGRAGHDNWMLKSTKDQKSQMTGSHAPKAWLPGANDSEQEQKSKGTSLHHILSKTVLDNILSELQAAMQQRKDPDLADSARGFNKQILKLCGKDVRESIGDVAKQLWNIPLNLELGPHNVIGDPGIGFDPNTIPDPKNEDERILDPVSAALKVIDDVYSDGYGGDKTFTVQHWVRMTEALIKAEEAHTKKGYALEEIARPQTDQWIQDENGTGFQRLGNRNFRGADTGGDYFVQDRDRGGTFDTYKGDNALLASHDAVYKGRFVTIRISKDAFYHCLVRHSYAYFSFKDSEIKAVNAFWPKGTTAQMIEAKIKAALPQIANTFINEIKANNADDPDLWTDDDLNAANQKINGDTVFYIVNMKSEAAPDPVEDDNDQEEAEIYSAPEPVVHQKEEKKPVNSVRSRKDQRRGKRSQQSSSKEEVKALVPQMPAADPALSRWVGVLKTFAPDGKSGDAYTNSQLKEIKAERGQDLGLQ